MPEDLNPTVDHVAKSTAKIAVDWTGAYVADPDTTLPERPTGHRGSGQFPSIPDYDIHGEIARGGMGVVLEARDAVLDREVAIKVLLPGSDSTTAAERFVREAKLTARLPHPGIPPVHSMGTLADGTPYLAMKLIRGQTLAKLLASPDRPSLPRLLQIFEQIAQAVGFAHTQGIIHRDLKPLNVMAGAFGEVQVMDWGLARELQDANVGLQGEKATNLVQQADTTLTGAILGTPAYMSPEQARGDAVDARTDVFSLGAILCEMLTGERPWGNGSTVELLGRAQQALLEPCFQRLAATTADFELLALARRALAPRVEDRFVNGQAVAEAVAHYRSGVEDRLRQAETNRAAAEARASEQVKKRRVMQVAGGVIAAVLLLGIIGTTLGLLEARQQEHRANTKAAGEHLARLDAQAQERKALAAAAAEKFANEQTRNGNEIILKIFEDLDIRKVRQGRDPLEDVLAKRLAKAAAQLEGASVGKPVDVAQLQNRLGQSLLTLGYPDEAIPLLQKARATRSGALGSNHRDTLRSMTNLAEGYRATGKLDLALPLLEETLKLTIAMFGPDDPDTLINMNNLALGYHVAGNLDLALPLYEETLKRRTARRGPSDPDTLYSMSNLASGYRAAGKSDLALPLSEETLKSMKANLGPDHPDTLGSMNNLAVSYRIAGKLDLALPLLEETLKLRNAKQGPDHPDTLTAMNNLAMGYWAAEKLDLALPLLEETLRLRKVKRGPNHPDSLTSMNNLALGYRNAGKLDLALPLLEETLKLMKGKHGPDHPDTLASMNNLAMTYQAAGKLDLALPLLEETLRLGKVKRGPDHPDSLTSMNNLALGYLAAGKRDMALSLFEEILEFRKVKHGPDHPDTLVSMGNLATAYLECQQGTKAVPLFQEYFQQQRKRTKANDSGYATQLANTSHRLLNAGLFAIAEPFLYECLAIRETVQPVAWTTFETKSMLGGALLGQKKYKEAEPLLLAGYEGMKQREESIPAPSRFRLPESLDRLIDLSMATDKPNDVKKWQAERAKYPQPAPVTPVVPK